MAVSVIWLSAWYGCQRDMAVSEIWLYESGEKKSQKLCVAAKTGLLTTKIVNIVSRIWLSARYGCWHDMAVSMIWLSAWKCCTKEELKIVRCRQVRTTTVTEVSNRYLSARYSCQRDMAVYIATIWLSLRYVRHMRPEDHHGPVWIVDVIVLQCAFWTHLCFNLHSGRKCHGRRGDTYLGGTYNDVRRTAILTTTTTIYNNVQQRWCTITYNNAQYGDNDVQRRTIMEAQF